MQACCKCAEIFWADSKKPGIFCTLCAYLRMRYPLPRVREVRDASNLRSNACKCLAGLLRVYRKSLGHFKKGGKLFPLCVRTCACAFPYLGCAKFGTPLVCDLTLSNDSQACCESAEKVWADTNKPGNFSRSGCVPTDTLPPS